MAAEQMHHEVLACFLLVLAAGCSAPPSTPTDAPSGSTPTAVDSPTRPPGELSITVENPQNGRYAVEVAAVSGAVDGFRVTYADGTARTYDESAVAALPPGALDNATGIRPTNAVASTRIDTGDRSRVKSRLPLPAGERTVFYAIVSLEQPPTVRVAGVRECDQGGAGSLSVDVRDRETVTVESNC